MRVRSAGRASAFGLVVGLAGLGTLGGCSTADRYRMNPTPEIVSLGQTRDEIMNQRTIVLDTNLRALHEDAARFFLMDRPSRMVPQTIPY